MKRALVLCAVLSFGGCQCFDDAYADYCRTSGKCIDGGPGGGPQGGGGGDASGGGIGGGGGPGGGQGGGHNATQVRFAGVPGTIRAGGCGQSTLELRDMNGDPAVLAGATLGVTLGSTPAGAIEFFDSASCTSPTSQLTASMPSRPFWWRAVKFGSLELLVSSPGLMASDTATTTAQARLIVSPRGIKLPVAACMPGSMVTFTAVSIDDGMTQIRAAAPANLAISMTDVFQGFDSASSQCVADFTVSFSLDQRSVGATLGAPDAGSGRLTANGGGFFENEAVVRLETACSPPSGACTVTADCCSGASCTGTVCCLAQTAACINTSDCCSGSCSSFVCD